MVRTEKIALDPEGLEKAAEAIDPSGWRLRRSSALPVGHEGRDAVVRRSLEQAHAAVSAYLGHAEVTTVEGLEEMPVNSVVLDRFDYPHIAGRGAFWNVRTVSVISAAEFYLPATVIHRPTP